MKNDLEVHCPKCEKMFKNESDLFTHLDAEHVSDKQHFKELILEIDARYVGGCSIFAHYAFGNLSLYSYPQNKIVFNSAKFVLEIPIDKIKSVIAKGNLLTIEFRDAKGNSETAFFDGSSYFTDFANEFINLRMDNGRITRTQSAKEPIVKVRCSYCKYTYSKKLDKCPHCGAMSP
jgi:uncharacterized C2H2 Zn-finger protein